MSNNKGWSMKEAFSIVSSLAIDLPPNYIEEQNRMMKMLVEVLSDPAIEAPVKEYLNRVRCGLIVEADFGTWNWDTIYGAIRWSAHKNTFIILYNRFLAHSSDEMIQAVIKHELGHLINEDSINAEFYRINTLACECRADSQLTTREDKRLLFEFLMVEAAHKNATLENKQFIQERAKRLEPFGEEVPEIKTVRPSFLEIIWRPIERLSIFCQCGSLRYEKTGDKIGHLVTPYGKGDDCTIEYRTGDKRIGTAPFLGHSRSESPRPNNSVLVKIDATQYTEDGVWFDVPKGKCISAFLIRNNSFPTGAGIFIITRPAKRDELERCKHPRHPVFTDK